MKDRKTIYRDTNTKRETQYIETRETRCTETPNERENDDSQRHEINNTLRHKIKEIITIHRDAKCKREQRYTETQK